LCFEEIPVTGNILVSITISFALFVVIFFFSISLFVSAWKSCSKTDAVKFGNMIQECLDETRALLEETEKLARL
jgi:hypothetical protein